MIKYDYITVRMSHLMRHASVGAVVRGPSYTVTMRDTNQWTNQTGAPAGRVLVYIEQVKSSLGIDRDLREPPVASENDGRVDGVCLPAQIFPAWMRCTDEKCGLLHRVTKAAEISEEAPTCSKCKRSLKQIPWVLVHPHGYMNDVHWHNLAHLKARKSDQDKRKLLNQAQKQCAPNWEKPYLSIKGNERVKTVSCTCGAIGRFRADDMVWYAPMSQQPWIHEQPTLDPGSLMGRILEVNDARVHSAVTRSALVIPPESRIRHGSVVDRIYSSSERRSKLEKLVGKSATRSGQILRSIATDLRCSVDEVREAMIQIDAGYPLFGKSITPGLLLESEYKAFLEPLEELSDAEDFVVRHKTDIWRQLVSTGELQGLPLQVGKLVDTVISVDRLKEILVFTGFTRLASDDTQKIVPPHIVEDEDPGWYPALEFFGEGIFISLHEEVLARWEEDDVVRSRARWFTARLKSAEMNIDPEIEVDARFLLLHSISHMLIKELEKQSGYPAASLKERIYSASASRSMSGILVYVAIPDVVGSLGGLAELAEPKRLLALLTHVFQSAQWCSLDPVCAEHEGQGPSLLNRAACHACQLLPETSCICQNALLDRLFVKGDKNISLPSILDFVP